MCVFSLPLLEQAANSCTANRKFATLKFSFRADSFMVNFCDDDAFILIRKQVLEHGRRLHLFVYSGTWEYLLISPSHLINMYECFRPDEDLCIFRCGLITASPSTFRTLNQTSPYIRKAIRIYSRGTTHSEYRTAGSSVLLVQEYAAGYDKRKKLIDLSLIPGFTTCFGFDRWNWHDF